MDIWMIVTLIGGLGLLVIGGEFLVRGAASLAAVVGISPLIVGLTVVAFGTSAPELAVSLQSALSGQSDIALGNVVGSNIFNVLCILGICAVIVPLSVAPQLVRLDVPIMIGASFLMLVLAMDGQIGRLDGLLLFGSILAYVALSIAMSRKAQEKADIATTSDTPAGGPLSIVKDVLFAILGVALLVVGADWLVDGAVEIARLIGVSELVIGLTIVAAGTSLPEVATSIVASIRGERDIAVGNVVGSNIFNILCILGLTGIVAPVNVPLSALHFDIPFMIVVVVVCLSIFFTGFSIERWEGLLFLGGYITYTTFLILQATQHDALPAFSYVLLVFVAPPIAILLIVLTLRALRYNPPAEHKVSIAKNLPE